MLLMLSTPPATTHVRCHQSGPSSPHWRSLVGPRHIAGRLVCRALRSASRLPRPPIARCMALHCLRSFARKRHLRCVPDRCPILIPLLLSPLPPILQLETGVSVPKNLPTGVRTGETIAARFIEFSLYCSIG